MTPQISLILPAYNEARVIPVTIAEAVRYFESRGAHRGFRQVSAGAGCRR